MLLTILLYIIKLEYHFTDCLYFVILSRSFHFNFSISSDLLFVYFVLFFSCFLFYKSFCIYLSINLSVYPSINLSINPSIYLSVNPSIYQSINRSIDLSIYLSIYLASSFDLCSCFFSWISGGGGGGRF